MAADQARAGGIGREGRVPVVGAGSPIIVFGPWCPNCGADVGDDRGNLIYDVCHTCGAIQ